MDNSISFSGNITAQINFAMQQNRVPVFRNMAMTNRSDQIIENVRLRIRTEPGFTYPFESAPADLRPGVLTEISPVDVVINAEYLLSLTEKLSAAVILEAVQGEEVIASEVRQTELLAYDQWSGVSYMPETAAAFIAPNHPLVQQLVSNAGKYLQEWCGDPSFTGYLSNDPNRVRQQMAAVYAAIQAENIAYALPPASFETAQRISAPDAVLTNKKGTCLDLAVLYCSCLESAGLNPMLVMVRGHAFAGCWLTNETFPDCLEYDMSALTKRIADGVNNIGIVECTDMTAGKNIDFDTSAADAEKHLSDHSDFYFAIDVIRTRSGGIRPMPSRIDENGTFKAVDYGERKRSEITSAPDAINVISAGDAPAAEVTKQVIWERKLLDLSLRNSLLNFRPTSMNVQLMADSLPSLEDEIARGEDFKVMPVPADMDIEISESKFCRIDTNKEQITSVTASEFKSHRLRSFMKESDLEKVMKKLHRLAKVSIEENGANTIYLALGFLRWYETEKSEKPRYAPLVLVPVDIIRKVQEKAYVIRMRDEDTQVNITLLEMLRQFFGINIKGLDPVPEDESGVDIPLIFSTIRQGVMAQPRWDIEEYAFIGQFSFNRFIMWNDIRNRSAELASNKVVASLISGKTEWEAEDIYISPLDLDNNVAPSDLAVPLSADSSQLAAVYAAAEGKSFVLHGPPGSGKSQTITNMIASALYHGKTVLFVAEKMAALTVVEKRLNKIGLGPFCLELHSNKAQKRAVLDQLEETLNVGKIKQPQEYKAQADKIAQMRRELNSVMSELHKIRNYGCSLYDAAVKYEQFRDCGGKFSFTEKQISSMSGTSYQTWHETLESLAAAGRSFGDVPSSSLRLCTLDTCTPTTRDEFGAALSEFRKQLGQARAALSGDISAVFSGKLTYTQAVQAAGILSDSCSGKTMLLGRDWEAQKPAVEKLISSQRELNEVKAEVLSKFEPTVCSYDAGKALVNWKTVQGKWFIPKMTGSSKLVKELAAHAKSPKTVTKANIAGLLGKISRMNTLTAEINGTSKDILGNSWQGEQTDLDALTASIEHSEKIRAAAAASSLSENDKSSLLAACADKFTQRSDTSQYSSAAAAMKECFGKLSASAETLKNRFAVDTDKLLAGDDWIQSADDTAADLTNELPQLKEWTGIVGICKKLRELGIGETADAFLEGKTSPDDIISSFDSDISRAMVTYTISGSRELSHFQGTLFDESIRRFKEVSDEFSQLTIKELAAELSARVPAAGTSAASSEVGILQKAIKSNGRMMSIRKLFDSIPNLLRRMCPCMLMSPISVAQYIDPSYPKFDLVIFDEASQLPTCEAVGAIARGENVIVVGDPKQLPPTSFFSASNVDEENYEKEDLESVLDDCLALSMPQKHLLWHYRSRHESLIAYSNARYYENKLYTFPSPDDQVSKVSWVHVDGFYDKGSTKQNKAEAQAIVDEIARRLADPELRKLSIGVVTFSMPQQNLIDDLLTDAYRNDPQLETWANEQYEPILIKNLENVQGDERDVILFSVGYGPDKDGKVSMNFGPLNRDGGWRRLNVAISRSRCEMIVFSVITPEMIDLSRTRSDGVEGLKGFLEFAAKGRSALPVRSGTAAKKNGFASVIAEELGKLGYSAECGVGCSDYKIDVAVKNPDDPDSFLLGINCGGKDHYENSNAYDRTLSQPSVLRGLGWNVMSVYIIDWLDNRQKVLGRIEEELNKALNAYRHPENKVTEEKKNSPIVFETEEASPLTELCGRYVSFRSGQLGTSADFTAENSDKISSCIMDILKAEAPVSRSALMKKVFSLWGITRPGTAMKRTFDQAFENTAHKTTSAKDTEFVWLNSQLPESYDKCRALYDEGQRRDAEDIPPEEYREGIRLIMQRQIALQREDLLRETAHLFGFSRLTSTLELAVSLGIKSAKDAGFIAFGEDGKVTYVNE